MAEHLTPSPLPDGQQTLSDIVQCMYEPKILAKTIIFYTK